MKRNFLALAAALALTASSFAQSIGPPASGGGSVSAPTKQVLATPGYSTVSCPAGATWAEIMVIAAGGGGGSGGTGAAGSAIRTGGGGGGGGGQFRNPLAILTSDLCPAGAAIPVVIGAGGLGGALVSSNSAAGNAGNQGGNTGIGTVWQSVFSPTTTTFPAIASNGSILVTAGAGGKIYTCASACETTANWTSRTSNTANAINYIVWAASLNMFVGVGAAGTIVTSPDAVTPWTVQTSNTANALNYVIFDGTALIAVGAAGTIDTSTNGTAWAVNAFTSANAINAITNNGTSLYVAVDQQGNIITATTAAGTYTAAQMTGATTTALLAIAFGSGTYVASGTNGVYWTCTATCTSTVNWTNRGAQLQRTAPFITFSNGYFFANQNYLNPADLTTWIPVLTSNAAGVVTFYGGAWWSVTNNATSFVAKLNAISFYAAGLSGGNPGAAGSTVAAGGGAGFATQMFQSSAGAGSVTSANASSSVIANCTGGGAGGGATAANANIGASIANAGGIFGLSLTQGFSGVNAGAAPTAGQSATGNFFFSGSSGGGGGAWTTAAAGQAGAAGGSPCGGGGGGAGADNGQNSGAGGNGGNGEIRIIWHYGMNLGPANDNEMPALSMAA